MPTRRPGANLRRGPGSLSGTEIEALNKLHPGLGTAINSRLGFLANRGDALSGQRGTVRLAPQKKQDQRGVKEPALALSKDRLSGLADPIDDGDAVSLGYLRRLFNCDWFEDLFDDCVEVEPSTVTTTGVAGEIPWFWWFCVQHPHDTDTDFFIFGADVIFPDVGTFNLLPFPLQANARFDNVAFWVDNSHQPTTTFPGIHFMNLGIYNTSRQLVWQLGPLRVFVSDGVYAPGFGRMEIDVPEVVLPAGEYYVAWFFPACLRVLSVRIDPSANILLGEPIPFHSGVYGLGGPGSAITPVLPDTVPGTSADPNANVVIVPLVLFTSKATIGYTG